MDTFEAIEPLIQSCHLNAETLLESAKAVVRSPGRNHIGYHLAALSLEEIGKAVMLRARAAMQGSQHEENEISDDDPISGHLEDHEHKLFWAIWTPGFLSGNIDPRNFLDAKDLAKRIHWLRLNSLYVSATTEEISDQDVTTVIGLAEARLGMEKHSQFRKLDAKQKQLLDWFMDVLDDPEMKPFVLSAESRSKLKEFDTDRTKWIEWLRERIREINAKNQEILARELARGESAQQKEKWQIKLRFYSLTHSVRPKALLEWNEKAGRIKLFPSSDKSELITHIVLGSNVPVISLWDAGFQIASMFLCALNIATVGFHWWYLSKFASRFDEEIVDLENKARVVAERNVSAAISLDRKKRPALKKVDLERTAWVFAHLITRNSEQAQAYARYYRGLSLIAKNDVFSELGYAALVEFYEAWKAGLAAYDGWDRDPNSFPGLAEQVFADLTFSSDNTAIVSEFKRLIEVAVAVSNQRRLSTPVRIDDAFKLKVMCDMYFQSRARREVPRVPNERAGMSRAKNEDSEPSS